MATLVLTDAFVSVDGNDISSEVRSVALNYAADMIEDDRMSITTHRKLGGLKDWSLVIEAANDFAAAALDSILFPLVGTSVAIVVRPTSSAKGANNPEYTGTGIFEGYPPFGNSVGELATTSFTINAAGNLARAV